MPSAPFGGQGNALALALKNECPFELGNGSQDG
jgi:hypothetical protein